MCGRFTAMFSWDELVTLYADFIDAMAVEAARQEGDLPARYNIAPTQPVLVIRRDGATGVPQTMRWGLVPGWVKDPNDFPLLINARSETMAEKASFRNSLKNQRCLVPANGYYEWRKNADGTKTPFYITRADGELMLFAGLFATWMGPDGEEMDSVAIVTRPAQGELRDIHERTPAILGDRTAADWLDTARVNAPAADRLIAELSAGEFVARPVSTRVNSPTQDDEGLIVPVFEEKPEKPAIKKEPKEDAAPPRKKAGGQLDLF